MCTACHMGSHAEMGELYTTTVTYVLCGPLNLQSLCIYSHILLFQLAIYCSVASCLDEMVMNGVESLFALLLLVWGQCETDAQGELRASMLLEMH